MHVLLDGFAPAAYAREYWTPEMAADLCAEIVEAAEMTVIFGPMSRFHEARVHAFCVIAESHVSMELDTLTGQAWADIFSCKPVPNEALRVMIKGLGLNQARVRFLDRTELDALIDAPA